MNRRELAAGGFVTVAQAAAFTGLRRSKLYDLMASGELIYAKVGSARRIPHLALIDMMARHLIAREDQAAESIS